MLLIQKITSLYTERWDFICQDPHQVSPNFGGKMQGSQLFKKNLIFHSTQVDVLSVWRKCEDTQLQPSIMYKPADRKYSYSPTRQIWKGGLNHRNKSRDYHHS